MTNNYASIYHVGLRVGNVAYFVNFFQKVFNMSITKTRGSENAPDSVWLNGGIQLLNEHTDTPMAGTMHHISLFVDDIEETQKKAEEFGATPFPGKGKYWFQIPQGIVFELKAKDN